MSGETKRTSIIFLLLATLMICSLCTTRNPDARRQERRGPESNFNLNKVTALPQIIPVPTDNPLTEAKIELGKLLFYDPILSGNKDVACATCHHGSVAYAETRDLSIGVNGSGFGSKRNFLAPHSMPLMKKNSPTIINTAFNGIRHRQMLDPESAPMFWDLRAESLEKQSLEPIKTLEEMRGAEIEKEQILHEIALRIQKIETYQKLFANAFGDNVEIDSITISQAIASFERSLVTNNSRFDQYMRGDEDAISTSEKEGLELFKSTGCINCHNGPMFSDYKIHVLGVPHNDKLSELDKGFDGRNGFRTPSLRNLNLTAPYMHNGTMANLMRVLEFYEDISVGKSRNPNIEPWEIDPLVHRINIRVKDMSQIISFLNCLNDTNFDKTIPHNVPSGLAVGGNIGL